MSTDKYKCFFCAEGSSPRNAIDQLEIIARDSGISKQDIIQLALIDEIRKIRIAFEGQQSKSLVPSGKTKEAGR